LTGLLGKVDGVVKSYMPWGLGFGTLLVVGLIVWFLLKANNTLEAVT
jgi:hypothetical protein